MHVHVYLCLQLRINVGVDMCITLCTYVYCGNAYIMSADSAYSVHHVWNLIHCPVDIHYV